GDNGTLEVADDVLEHRLRRLLPGGRPPVSWPDHSITRAFVRHTGDLGELRRSYGSGIIVCKFGEIDIWTSSKLYRNALLYLRTNSAKFVKPFEAGESQCAKATGSGITPPRGHFKTGQRAGPGRDPFYPAFS